MVTIGKVAIGIEEASMSRATNETQEDEVNTKEMVQEQLLGCVFMGNIEREGSTAALNIR